MKHEKPELSRKNPYCLPKYRYLELKNFCFQWFQNFDAEHL